MDKQWRPKEWEEITSNLELDSHYGTSGAELGAFGYGVEAGADAMLEALRGKNEHLMKADVSGAIREFLRGNPLKRGVWVFIPNKE